MSAQIPMLKKQFKYLEKQLLGKIKKPDIKKSMIKDLGKQKVCMVCGSIITGGH